MNDDSGKPVRILSPHGFAEWPVKGDERMARLAARVALIAGYQHASLRFATWLVWFVCFIAIVIGLNMAFARYFPGLPGWLPIVFVFLLGSVVRRLRRRIRLAIGARKTAALLLEEGLCASCGYNLWGVPHSAEGVVHCPECGAAWFAARTRRAAPFATGAALGPALPMIAGQIERRDIATKDHEGRPTTLAWLRVPAIMVAPETRTDKMFRLLMMWQTHRRRWRWIGMPLLILMYVLLAAYIVDLILATSGRPMLGPWWGLLVMLPGVLICAAILRFNRRRAGVHRMLAAGFCPSCVADYPPEGASPGTVGHCAECGAAWRVPAK